MRCIDSEVDLGHALAPLAAVMKLPETEETWDRIEHALAEFQALTKQGATKDPTYVAHLRSERTRLSGTASDVLNSMAPRLGDRFASLVPIFVPTLVQICGRTNKVASQRAEKSLNLICRHCRLPQIVPYLLHALQEKAATVRSAAAASLVLLLEECEVEVLAKRVADIESAIQILATDANPQVRALGRQVYAQYAALWPSRCNSFHETLSTTAQRYLAAVVPAKREPSIMNSPSDATMDTAGTRKRVKRLVDTGTVGQPLQDQEPLKAQGLCHAKENERLSPREAKRDAPRTLAKTVPRTLFEPMPWGDPFQETGVPPLPPRGSKPSDGVAYRLALAQEQARLRSAQRQGLNAADMDMQGMRLGSRALVRSSASLGSARRVVRPRAAAETPRPERAAPSKDTSSPLSTHKQGEFTPKRRPFGVVNADRSPQSRQTPAKTEKYMPVPQGSPWAEIDT